MCSPSNGERSISTGESESLMGQPTLYHLPRSGWSTSTIISRSLTCSSFSQILGAHDRPAGHVEIVQDLHQLPLGVVPGELRQQAPHLALVGPTRVDGGEARIRRQRIAADARGQSVPYLLLHHHVEIIVGAAGLALDSIAELAAAGVVARPWREILELLHGVLGERATLDALMVPKLHTAEVHDTVHHGGLDVLAAPGALPLEQRREYAGQKVHAGARVADLCACHHGGTVEQPGGAHGAPHGLGHVLIGLEGGVRPLAAEALDGAHDDPGVQLVHLLPAESETAPAPPGRSFPASRRRT